jgi:hypothetical protein
MNPYILIVVLLTIGGLGFDDYRHYVSYIKEKDAYAQFVKDIKVDAADLKAQHDKDISEQETKHAQERADILLSYEREFSKLQDERSRAARPAPRPATVCNDAAANQRLSDTVEQYVASVEQRLAEFQRNTLPILESADLQTETLRRCQGYIAAQPIK